MKILIILFLLTTGCSRKLIEIVSFEHSCSFVYCEKYQRSDGTTVKMCGIQCDEEVYHWEVISE